MKKNLIFHCYLRETKSVDDATSLHMKCLDHYQMIFDGKKIACISSDEDNLNLNYLLSKVESLKIFDEIFFIKNHSQNRESESLLDLLSKVNLDDGSITFYAHNKGSTHSLDDVLKNWILSMYFFNLEKEYIQEIEHQLEKKFTSSGILKKDWKWQGIHDASGEWHYSGAFFWFNQHLFLDYDWRSFNKGRMSLESYLGQRVPTQKAYSTFVNKNYNFNIDQQFWDEELRPEKIGHEIMNRFSSLFHKF